jgi:CRISPR/Cas system-associated protein Cas10 (large subunit of type III CRISPR-Cas system)
MALQEERPDDKQMRCSVCKHPVAIRATPGRRRAALIEDGLTLCDVCAPSGNHQPIRFER